MDVCELKFGDILYILDGDLVMCKYEHMLLRFKLFCGEF